MTTHTPLPAEHYDVVVVGAGPAGLTTAVALARGGTSVLVVDKHPGLSLFPKATGLRPRTMEIIRSWGLEAAVLAASQDARLSMRVTPVLTVPGAEVSMGLPSEAELAAVSPCRIAVCPQDRLEAVLLQHLLERGGEVSFGTTFEDLVEDEDGVRLCLRTPDGRVVVTARYLVGADGAASSVRGRLGIRWTPLGSEGNHLSALFCADLSAVVPARPHVLTCTVAPGLEGMFVATGKRDRWIYDVEWHPEQGATLADWPTERVVERIRAAAGQPDLEVRLAGLFPWDFGAAIAERQREGRVFLVGDAAHRTTPRGATGMNTGIADGHNLGWKLAWVVRGWADPALLDSYEQERTPVGRANAEASLVTALGTAPTDVLAHDFGVVYRSGAIIDGGPLAGRRAPHVWIGAGRSTLDLFDGRLTVLTASDGSHAQQAAQLALSGLPVVAPRLDAATTDAVGAAYGIGPSDCVLVRPDGYVAWVALDHRDDDGRALRSAVRASLGRSTEPALC